MTKHIPALDGLRGVAALVVLVYHLATPLAQGTPFWRVVQFGWTGVDLFFVLSGFLITGILFDSLGAEGYFRTFYSRRALRIFPLYYGFLLIVWLASPLFAGQAEHFDAFRWPLLTYTQNLPWGRAYPMDIGHTWSLAVEEQFYLLWPAVIYFVRDRARLMRVCGFLIGAALLWRILAPTPFIAYAELPARMDALAIGALVALWRRAPGGEAQLLAAARRWWPPIAAGVVICAALAGTERVYFAPAQQTVGYTLWALLFAAVLVLATNDSRVLESRSLRHAGRISYALYLFHPPIIFAADALGGKPASWGFALGCGMTSYLLAAASWRYFEGPILRLRSRFEYRARNVAMRQLEPA